ncbi:CGNR zinc finger domain-containing protein [Streptomyces sp. SRF1]|uniref:CGNR zinc finger domain-containing protein n=1 Tax=Streptomyces sp. SRF1 TaxID=1549642 RepID=UPI0025B25D5A|nr:CGNR zinc finger domain-containing protein [Streptomyces sp. SRF1]MDN3061037.1 CGNR zinc finger domain-containing protein [Streptomyces sp. SRF1]
MSGEEALLEALNSTPVVDGVPRDLWRDGPALSQWAARRGGGGGPAEREWLRKTRDALQTVVRGESGPEILAAFLAGVRKAPRWSGDGLDWVLEVEAERRLAVELILAWARIQEESPGRLRPCANSDCRLFLVDHSRANTARWCSMRTCGNRLKARRHHERQRRAGGAAAPGGTGARPDRSS